MRHLSTAIGIAILSIVCCNPATAANSEKVSNKEITKEWNPGSFEEIEIKTVVNAKVVEGDAFHVRMKGDEELVNRATVVNQNNRLVIGHTEKYPNDKKKAEITITIPSSIKQIVLSGVGSVDCSAKTDPMKFCAKFSGVGTFSIKNVKSDRVEILTSGTGELTISGRAQTGTIKHSGVGAVNCGNLVVNCLECYSSGVGETTVHATEDLTVKSSGVGTVSYKGNPKNVTKKASLLGKVVQID